MKFKVGDRIKNEFGDIETIVEIVNNRYYLNEKKDYWFDFDLEDYWELVESDEDGEEVKESVEVPSMDYRTEYYIMIEELQDLQLLNHILLQFIRDNVKK